MAMWKIVSGLGAIAGGIAMVIIILAACIWMVAGVVGWLIDHSFAEVFGGEDEEEFEVPLRERIPAPPPIPRPCAPRNPALDVRTPPLNADFVIYPDIAARPYGQELWPEHIWVVSNGKTKVAWKELAGAIRSIPDGKTFKVLNEDSRTIQYGTKGENSSFYRP